MLLQSHIKFNLEENHVIASRANYKQFSRFQGQLGLLTQLQQDTKGNIMDIFLLATSISCCPASPNTPPHFSQVPEHTVMGEMTIL